MADGARRRERAGVIPLGPNLSATIESVVHRPSESDRQPADPTGECEPVGGFGDQMYVVVLHAELDDAKLGA